MEPITPREMPLGLPEVIARMAERVSNQSDVRNLTFHPAAQGLFMADLHADTLLWGIDPMAPRSGGHLDGHRLAAAGMSLQVFAAPTWTPLPFRNDEDRLVVSRAGFDQADALFPSEVFSPARRRSRKRRSRALKIAQRFEKMIADSTQPDAPFRAVPLFGPADFDGLELEKQDAPRAGEPRRIGVMLALEGLHWLAPDADDDRVKAALDELHCAGYRMLAPTHRFSNGLGGASENSAGRGGLTAAGRKVIGGLLDRRMVVDLAHASSALIREACGLALTHKDGPRPVLISHCGIKAINPTTRNLSVGDIRAVAATGGVIGVGFWRSAMGWADDEPFGIKMAYIIRSICSVLETLSDPDFADEMIGRYDRYDPFEHIAFGSDFDGATTTAFDVTGVSHVVAAMAAARDQNMAQVFPREKLALIAGENTRRVLRAAMT
jgi:membrane dipeptidase